MTISYTLQPVPFWYFSDLTGKPLAGGKLYSYSSINPTQSKPIYQDPAGVNEYPNPIIFDETGTIGPLYFQLDSDDGDDLYFIQILDKNDNLVRQIDQYPIGSGGGGGTVNTVQKIENIFVNSSFISNIDSTGTQPITNGTFLSSSAHTGLYYPDLTFIQSGSSNAQDKVTFLQFGLGLNPLSPDFSPAYYMNYTCLNSPSGEVYKGIRIPISQFVNTLANQIFTFVVYARTNGGGANTLNVQLRQYFGTGGSPSPDQITNLTPTPITMTSSFVLYSIGFSVPSVATKIQGNSNDDGTYIEILWPTSSACNIDIAKPALYAGSIFPSSLYESVEELETEMEVPRVGDVKFSMNGFSNGGVQVQAGWIPLNDGTIGNESSNSTTRAKPDTWLLYNTIWNGTTSANCPLYTSSGTTTTKGGTAIADWNANKGLSLPKTVGRVIADRGTGTVTSISYSAAAATDLLTVSSTTGFITGFPIVFSTAVPAPLVIGVTYYSIVISGTTMKVATSAEAAIAGTVIDLTTNSTGGTISTPPNYSLANFQGENVHQMTISEMPSHNHSLDGGWSGDRNAGGSQGTVNVGTAISLNSGFNGGNIPHNNVQPTVFYNMIIKL